MELSISGKIIDVLQEMSGEGRNGPWRKRDFILETQDNYPKTICMTQWGDQIDAMQLQKGSMVKAHIDIQSREYNGRWYTDIKAWRVEQGGADGVDDSANEFGGEANYEGEGESGFPDNNSANRSGSQKKSGDSFDISGDIDDDLPF